MQMPGFSPENRPFLPPDSQFPEVGQRPDGSYSVDAEETRHVSGDPVDIAPASGDAPKDRPANFTAPADIPSPERSVGCDSPTPPVPPERPPKGDRTLARRIVDLSLEATSGPDTTERGIDGDTLPEAPDRPGETDATVEKAEEDISPKGAYDIAREALLACGEYRGDAHYAFGDVGIVTPDGNEVDGTLKLTDYHSHESREFQVGPDGWAADPEEQARLLENGKAILGVSLDHKKGTDTETDTTPQPPFYDFIEPANIRPDLGIGESLEDEGIRTSKWPADKFIVVRTTRRDTSDLKYDTKIMVDSEEVNNDPQLLKIMEALRGMIEQGGDDN